MPLVHLPSGVSVERNTSTILTFALELAQTPVEMEEVFII